MEEENLKVNSWAATRKQQPWPSRPQSPSLLGPPSESSRSTCDVADARLRQAWGARASREPRGGSARFHAAVPRESRGRRPGSGRARIRCRAERDRASSALRLRSLDLRRPLQPSSSGRACGRTPSASSLTPRPGRASSSHSSCSPPPPLPFLEGKAAASCSVRIPCLGNTFSSLRHPPPGRRAAAPPSRIWAPGW
ncbi:PREDICTED: lysine-specific demethylase 6B-like isoform X1 [Rhinopithecus bieti]|uniref:lysine-specific demethylase 6B-like isoform X1 n=1 Tax=Rhinopithecus bieti TaxID=61621 RepID=UPI00083C351B|nr:PREDICTED: lysine-specific demethylase 6B-like isoform X1 [Rhinopithecus bieti]XP_017708403.1 PREDICTED: lysine-specific demethylase 6B-like isoform X1 [Rhinopithecus bieti]XP_017708404.1 PREDICTED: lysine-specific demethylase 6B-like isoform X1 [Rhinopithecus bieti]